MAGLYQRAGIAALAMLAIPMAADAQTVTRQTQEQAYGYAMKCFVANGVALGDLKDQGKTAEAEAQEAKARRSFDTATKFGNVLGYSGNRVSQDFGLAQATELPKMVKDRAYFQKMTVNCKAIGLM